MYYELISNFLGLTIMTVFMAMHNKSIMNSDKVTMNLSILYTAKNSQMQKRRFTTQEYNQLVILTSLHSEEIFQYVVCMVSFEPLCGGRRCFFPIR